MFSKIIRIAKGSSDGVKSGVAYTFANIVSKGITFITIPIFTRIMTTDQIGISNLYSSWFTIISIITTLSLTSGGYQLALKEFGSERDEYESSVLSITSLMAFMFFCVFVISPSYWSRILGIPKSLIVLMCLGLFFNPAQEFWLSRQRFDYKYKLSTVISVLSAIVASLVSVIAVMSIQDNSLMAEVRLWSNYLIIYGVGAVLWIYIIVKGKTFYNKQYWKFSLSLSIPLVGHMIAKQILDVSDRMMINSIIGPSAVGIYSTLYSISAISLIVWNSINAAYIPYLFKSLDSLDGKKSIKTSSLSILLLYSVISILMMLLAPEIVNIFATSEYSEAINIMPPIAIGVSLTAVSNMYSNILVYYKRTSVIMIASGVAAVLNVLLNAIAIPIYGYQAAAYTTLISYVILVLIESIVATKTYKYITKSTDMVYSNTRIICICSLQLFLMGVSLFLYKNNFIRYSFVFVLAVLFIIALYKRREVIGIKK